MQGDAAAGVVKGLEVLGQFPPVAPQQRACLGLQREDLTVGSRDEHHPVVDERRGLVARVHARGEGPDRHQLLDVAGFDLVQGAVAPALVIAADL